MKLLYAFIAALLAFNTWTPQGFCQTTAARTTNTPQSRLIATAAAVYDATGFLTVDSAKMTYTGSRGDSNGLGRRAHYDTLLSRKLNRFTGQWQLSARTIQTFDAADHLLTILDQQYDSVAGQWNNRTRQGFTYDAGGRLAADTSYSWQAAAAAWLPKTRTTFSYYPGGLMSLSGVQKWDSTGSSWYDESRCFYYYTITNRDSVIIHQVWNAASSSWVNTERTRIQYDAAGRPIVEQHDIWSTSPAIWEQGYATMRQFTPAGKVSGEVLLSWNNGWDTLSHKRFYRNATGDTLRLEMDAWNMGSKLHVSADTFAYNGDGRETLHIITGWSAATQSYRTLQRQITAYHSNGRPSVTHSETWMTGIGWMLTPFNNRMRFYYEEYAGQTPTAVTALPNTVEISVYPVPAQDVLNVVLKQPTEGGVVSLTDAQGRLCRQWSLTNGQTRAEYSVAGLPAGNYYLAVRGKDGMTVRTISIVR
jgi:hypothetical protein